MRPQHLHAVLDAGRAVGDRAEIVFTHGFLVSAEAAVIGCRRLQVARLQTMPHQLLVLFRAERRAHDVRRGDLEVGVAIHGIVDEQVTGQYLAVDPLSFVTGTRNRFERLSAGVVHDIQRRAQHLGDANRAIGSLALDLGRPRQRMGFGPRDALFEQLFLQAEHELAVFGMHGRYRAEFQRTRKAVHEYFVVGHDGALVRHEVLEAVDAVIANQRAHVLVDAVVPPGHGNVERIVGHRFLGPVAPLVIGLEQVLLRIRNGEVDDHRRAAREARGRARVEILGRHGAHEWQLHVRVRVDPAGHYELSARVDDRCTFGCIEIFAHGSDNAVLAQYVRPEGLFSVDDGAALDEYCHDALPISPRAAR